MKQWFNGAMRNAGFRLFRFRSPLLTESQLLSLPPGTEMVHFPGFARTRLWIQRAVSGFYPEGFPHSEIPGSKGASPSPRLFAGSHVLRRRLAPRHPPYALSSLTIKSAQHTKHNRQSPVPSQQFQTLRGFSLPTFDFRLSTVFCCQIRLLRIICPGPLFRTDRSFQPPDLNSSLLRSR